MKSDIKRKLWQAPWGYPESFVIVLGIVIIGLLLEAIVGSFDFFLLAKPINYITGGVFILLSIVIVLRLSKSSFSRWFVSTPLSIVLIVNLLILTIIMGIIPQMTFSNTLFGLDAMTSNWAFVMVYGFLLLVLGAIIIKRLRRFKICDISFYLNHLGLYIVLFASGLGYSDMQRYIMYVNEGETEWRVYDSEKNIKELPIAIYLKDFEAQFYPSKSIYLDIKTGEIQHGDSEKFKDTDKYRSVMTEPEPKHFSSKVEVYTESGSTVSATIEVNKPLRIESWSIYQYGYDNLAGNMSKYSSFELVYDSWITPVYIGIIMMMLGSVFMIIVGHKAKSE